MSTKSVAWVLAGSVVVNVLLIAAGILWAGLVRSQVFGKEALAAEAQANLARYVANVLDSGDAEKLARLRDWMAQVQDRARQEAAGWRKKAAE